MKVKVLEKDPTHVKFEIDGTNPAFVNSLRRTILCRVPTLAIDEVTFVKNTSGLFDESLAHRLGLIPWKFDPKTFRRDENVEFSLKAKGPVEVKAKNIKFPKGIEPVNPDLLVISLYKDQEIDLEANARLGEGMDHAKWQSAVVSYQYCPEIKIGPVKNAKEISDACPTNVFEVKGSKLNISDLNACSICQRCADLSEGKIEVSDRADKFIFSVESVSGLTPKEIVLEALKILNEEVEDFKDSLKTLK